MEIKNSTSIEPDIRNIVKKGVSSKRRGGLGLYYASKVISKNKNVYMTLGYKENIFTAKLVAPKSQK